MNRYRLFVLGIIAVLVLSCTNSSDFLIEKGRVGKLTNKTTITELASIFKTDSLVIKLSDDKSNKNKYFHEDDEYIVYEKGGKHLLTIVPMEQNDTVTTIKSIEIFDNRFKTKRGITLLSPFKDINSAYTLSITNTLLSAHIDIDELNATMSIDKKEIGINEFNRDEINPDQIPKLITIKHFTIWFN